MKNLFIVLCLFSFPVFVNAEEIKIEPLSSLMLKLDTGKNETSEKKAYRDFCDTMSNRYGKLIELFESDTTIKEKDDLKNEWMTICREARADIKHARVSIIDMVGGTYHEEGIKWFKLLMKLNVKLETEGLKAFLIKVDISKLIDIKEESLINNKNIKKENQKHIDKIDDLIESANLVLDADNKKMWLEAYKANVNSAGFINVLSDKVPFVYNLSEAAMKKIIKDKDDTWKDEPENYREKVNSLDNWVIEEEEKYFPDLNNIRIFWKSFVRVHFTAYIELHEEWFEDLRWLRENTMLKNSDYMKNWKWHNMGRKYYNINKKVKEI